MIKKFILPLLLLVCGVAAGLVMAGRMRSGDEVVALPQARATVAATSGRAQAAPSGLPDFSAIAERSVGGVTNISSTRIIRTPNSPFANDPFFRYFMGDQDDLFGYRDRVASSAGSGVIVSADGYVLTNNHVVANAVGSSGGKVTVTFPDNRDMAAEIVGADELTDLALLKVANVHDLPTLPWGDSSQLKLAEWVLAIGNPFSIGQTVTLGIVSATKRNLQGQIAGYEDFIQTDAAINPGNSGGALINARGELVGINTAIYSETGGYQGIGFAVPSNLARRIMTDLQKYGSVRRGSIGRVDVMAVSPQYAHELGVPDTKGALIYQMSRSSEAYAAGLRPGDVVVRFNNQLVDEPSQFLRLLADTPIGSTVKLGIIRDGRHVDLNVKVNAASRRRQ